MPEQNWFAHILNSVLAGPVDGLLRALHVAVPYPQAPITNTFAMEVLVALVLAIAGTLIGRRLSVERPGASQQVAELSWNGIGDHAEDVIGHGGKRFLNFLITLSFFILLGNLFGLIPYLEAPTATETVTLGLALTTFFYYHVVGLRKHGGWGYFKTFFGPVWWLIPLMLPLEIISNFARLISLSVRLYANMFVGDLLITVFLALLPVTGILFMGLHLFEALLQTYIFLVLAMVYLAGATATEH